MCVLNSFNYFKPCAHITQTIYDINSYPKSSTENKKQTIKNPFNIDCKHIHKKHSSNRIIENRINKSIFFIELRFDKKKKKNIHTQNIKTESKLFIWDCRVVCTNTNGKLEEINSI